MAKIVVVDDNLLDNKGIASTAQALGHEAVRAFTLAGGRRALRAGGVDAVFLDTGLPDGDGLKALAEFVAAPGAPAVVLMATAPEQERARAAKGAKGLLLKPCNAHDVARLLDDLLAAPAPPLAAAEPELPGRLTSLREFRDSQEKRYLQKLLAAAGGDVASALKISGVSRASYYNLLKKHGLNPAHKA